MNSAQYLFKVSCLLFTSVHFTTAWLTRSPRSAIHQYANQRQSSTSPSSLQHGTPLMALTKKLEVVRSDLHNNNIMMNEQDCQKEYLRRIGFSEQDVNNVIVEEPSLPQLQKLLTAHLRSVPFENMDQHEHPSHENTPRIPKRPQEDLPSLDVTRSLEKIVYRKRGGFCFELNFAFRWLLEGLGYTTRLALADVACNQTVPAHVVILVDDLKDSNNGISDHDDEDSHIPVLVDVGFGDPGVCNVLLPVQFESSREDTHSDVFQFHQLNQDDSIPDSGDIHAKRFDTMLCRTRVGSPQEVEKMYRFRLNDNMKMEACEFQKGLERVLTISPTFTGKRICVVSDNNGHVTLGRDYIKWVERGDCVRRIELPTETAWRMALKEHFGILLDS